MSDAAEPRTGHPDKRHSLGELRGAAVRDDVLELHAAEGSVTVSVPEEQADDLLSVAAYIAADSPDARLFKQHAERLSATQRDDFRACVIEGRTQSERADEREVTTQTVNESIRRARERLHAVADDTEGER